MFNGILSYLTKHGTRLPPENPDPTARQQRLSFDPIDTSDSLDADIVTSIKCTQILRDEDDVEPISASSNAVIKRSMTTIVVIDRDSISLQVIECMFSERNIEFIFIDHLNALQELQRYRADHSDATWSLVVLDISIGNPFELIMYIRSKFSKSTLPILLSATSRYEDTIYEALDRGANDFVYKPFRYKEMNYRVNNLLQLSTFIRKDSILSDILPVDIIQNLEHGINFMAKHHSNVTILFSDICSYTRMSSDMPTKKIIHILNTMFCGFDDICIASAVYKVETIGDAYMIASGHDGKVDHVPRMIDVGIKMLEFMKNEPTLSNFSIRIGIHTGSAHSGVIGKIRPRYCFFGDTINCASRMESHGVPNHIQISESVYTALTSSERNCFQVEPRGYIDIKGKGLMKTYLIASKSTQVFDEIDDKYLHMDKELCR